MRAAITGTGMYVPPLTIDNDGLAKIMETSDEWIQVRTGIRERHYADPDMATSDIALPAARAAIEDAGLTPEEIDYLIVATMTPDYYFPGSAPVLQAKLGLVNAACLDIRQQCAGFIYALQLADAVIRAGQYRKVLVVGAEAHVMFMPWSERSWQVAKGETDEPLPAEEIARNTETRDRTVLFGDGGGAMVLEPSENGRGILDVLVKTDGTEVKRLWTPAGGSAYRPYFHPDMYHSGDQIPIVEGRKVYVLAVTRMPEVVLEILERNDLTLDDIDLVVMHQANLRINEAVQKRLGLPDEKVFNNIGSYGNTTAGTIPIAFHEAVEQGRAKPGDLVCFVGLGSGLNWGAVLCRI
ncbi:MAG TPA: ketoacyl-ACP synthase III [Acidobacteria bacterium]|nr:ketoacyl-ACP synthase III [Acidobacteriota bacterium]